MKEIVICSKCKGSGKYEYRSGIEGVCYQCDGKGKQYKYTAQSFKISIETDEGRRIDWINITGKSKAEAERKAKKIAERGIYKDKADTIIAEPDGVTHTYRKIK